jgi:sugar/nucleoside kinase (ribokinase family)
MNHHSVDTSLVFLDEKRKTGLAFVSLDEKRVPDYLFYRDPSASMFLCPEDIKEDYFQHAKALYFSSMSLVNEPFRSANYTAIDYAKKYGLFVAFDPNVRISLWNSEEEAKKEIKRVIQHVDVLKVNTEEMSFLQDTSTKEDGIFTLFDEYTNLKLVTLTWGDKGSVLWDNKGNEVHAESFRVVTQDTTGAGDAFMAALLSRIIAAGGLEQAHDLLEIGRFANAAAASIIQRTGVIPAMPEESDILDLLRSQCALFKPVRVEKDEDESQHSTY